MSEKQTSLLDLLVRDYMRASDPASLRKAARLSIDELISTPSPTHAIAALRMMKTPRFYLRKNVVDAIRKMVDRNREDAAYFRRMGEIVAKKPELIKPPFLHTWIEMVWGNAGAPGADKRIALDMVHLHRKFERYREQYEKTRGEAMAAGKTAGQTAHEVQRQEDIFSNSLLMSSFFEGLGGDLRPNPVHGQALKGIIVARDGAYYINDPSRGGLAAPAPGGELFMVGVLSVCTLLMLNSRTPILKLTPPDVPPFLRRRNNEKIAEGKFAEQPFHVIEFDLAREFRRHPNQSVAEAEAAMAEHIVMGHFKLRESGLHWWSPHWRGGTEEERAERKGREALAARETQALFGGVKSVMPGGLDPA